MSADLSSDRLRKNITIGERRTSVSLERQVWDGLIDICRREEFSVDDLCTDIEKFRRESSMSSSLRVFLLTYFRLTAEYVEGELNRKSPAGIGAGLGQPPQQPFPSLYDKAMEKFAADQRRYAKG
ncbi:MAG: ribbon-helix-helix domain-containing protein [Rhodospirillaceae bacterium]|nr:ribbon-helix-helix domain-containing protein [Rhodospirillaceae bacterium]MBT6136910.1 ribbon-helix-helix domain-containing protein [Rhodospirillaceae bacterium]